MPSFKTLVTYFLILSSSFSFAQVSSKQDSTKLNSNEFIKVEIEASYPGGVAAWKKFLEKNLDAGVTAKNDAPVGKYSAMAIFIVDKDGSLSDVKALTKFNYGIEDEMLRVISKSGKWTPASQDGKPVKAYRKQPLTFIVDSGDFTINSTEPYTLFTNMDNEITVRARKIKPGDININVPGGKAIALGEAAVFWAQYESDRDNGRIVMEVCNLATHGGLGDGGHFGLAAYGVGNFVHALNVDQCGVHVKRDELEVGQLAAGLAVAQDQTRGEFLGG